MVEKYVSTIEQILWVQAADLLTLILSSQHQKYPAVIFRTHGVRPEGGKELDDACMIRSSSSYPPFMVLESTAVDFSRSFFLQDFNIFS